MDSREPQRAWLLMAAGDNRGHGGNAGYDDQHDAYYSWDSNVPNYSKVEIGDPIALWDKRRLLGISVIEDIETSSGPKLLHRCPNCNRTRISPRKTKIPKYRCMKCNVEFNEPVSSTTEVKLYRARYDAAWVSLDGVLDEQALRACAVNSGDINAMRPLNWDALRRALGHESITHAVDRVTARVDFHWRPETLLNLAPQGFTEELVRVRRGQMRFREHLLKAQGNLCAFTGAAPAQVLEAGHLYSYAQLGTHFEHGGLMLRRDIHRLFDDGMLAVRPRSLRIDVAPWLEKFPQYAQLHDEPLQLRLRGSQVKWLDKHWTEHRGP
ncbi:HNH endonuclease [Ornithinimicrobium sp. Arc0846-15]|nr:HNH endonuclease [Ornithinimicrobium laminariae]